MKRVLIILIVCLVCAFECGPDLMIHEHVRWFVMNLTDDDIVVNTSCWLTIDKVSLSPGELNFLYLGEQSNAPEVAKMEDLFSYAKNPKNWFFSVIKDGTVVKKWTVSDLDVEGHQFPKAESWKKNIIVDGRNTYVDWTFYIFPDDLAPQEQQEQIEK